MWFLLTLHFKDRATHEARKMKFGAAASLWRKMKPVVKNTWSGQPRGRARPATSESVRNRRLKGSCLTSKSMFAGDQKKPNNKKARSSWLFVTEENQKIKFGWLTAPWLRTRLASSLPALRRIYQCGQTANSPTISDRKTVLRQPILCCIVSTVTVEL